MAHTVARATLRHPNRNAKAREKAFDWLAAQFTHITPAEMRAAELMFGPATPVGDRMRGKVAVR